MNGRSITKQSSDEVRKRTRFITHWKLATLEESWPEFNLVSVMNGRILATIERLPNRTRVSLADSMGNDHRNQREDAALDFNPWRDTTTTRAEFVTVRV